MNPTEPRRIRRRHPVRSTLLFLARLGPPVLLFAISVWGVSSQPPPRVCTEFFDSDAVFTGKVIAARRGADPDPANSDLTAGWFYRLQMRQSFRGPTEKTIEVYTENASARYRLEVGRSYLLFARKWGDRFVIGCCENSAYLEESADKIRQIEQIKKTRSGGEIAGRIGWGQPDDYVGVRVVAVGVKQSYEALTDRFGWFHIPVPEGNYEVHVEAPGHRFVPFDLSYDDPNHIVVHPGGCPQMQFMPEEAYGSRPPAPKPD